MLVTEHGAGRDDSQDHRRVACTEASPRDLAPAITDDMNVRGYLHWSLPGDYEWFYGCHGHCGVLGVARAACRRSVRPSAAGLGGIARADGSA